MKKHLPVIFTAIRLIGTLAILFIVSQNAHWSVTTALFLISFAIEGQSALIKQNTRFIKATRSLQKDASQNFNEFIETLNRQSQDFHKKISTCKECEVHGQHGIRPGSVHNRAAENCLMHDKV